MNATILSKGWIDEDMCHSLVWALTKRLINSYQVIEFKDNFFNLTSCWILEAISASVISERGDATP